MLRLKLKILKLYIKNVDFKLVKLNNIGGSWFDLGVPVVIDHVVVSSVLRIFLKMCGD
jgi:hypothetical protein